MTFNGEISDASEFQQFRTLDQARVFARELEKGMNPG